MAIARELSTLAGYPDGNDLAEQSRQAARSQKQERDGMTIGQEIVARLQDFADVLAGQSDKRFRLTTVGRNGAVMKWGGDQKRLFRQKHKDITAKMPVIKTAHPTKLGSMPCGLRWSYIAGAKQE